MSTAGEILKLNFCLCRKADSLSLSLSLSHFLSLSLSLIYSTEKWFTCMYNLYPYRLVNLPVFDLYSLTDAPDEVDQQLALDAVVDDHSSVGYVQHYEPYDRDDHQYPSNHDV